MDNNIIVALFNGIVEMIGVGGVIAVLVIHIILTFAVYKWKGGPIACFYFFLAPLAIFIIFFIASGGGEVKSNSKHHHHHFH